MKSKLRVILFVGLTLASLWVQSQDIDKIMRFIASSDTIKADLYGRTKKRITKKLTLNFCYDTTYKLVSGCDQSNCNIENIRIAQQGKTPGNNCQITKSRGVVNILCQVIKLKPDTYYISLIWLSKDRSIDDQLKMERWGESHEYILDMHGEKGKILQKRNLIIM